MAQVVYRVLCIQFLPNPKHPRPMRVTLCVLGGHTLLENVETQKGPTEDYSPSEMGPYGFPC